MRPVLSEDVKPTDRKAHVAWRNPWFYGRWL